MTDPTATAAFDPGATRTAGGASTPAATGGPPSIPGYVIDRELGRGGMGVVYLARQVRLNRDVALKMILGGGHASDTDLARFLAEGEAGAAVPHPGIVQVFESGQHDGLPYFALEYCPGGSLAQKLAGTPLPPREAAALVARLAGAVQAAHEKGIVHRDLKPANVLLAGDGTAKVTDFGLARRSDSASGLTATGAVLGTPSYMAPEQAGGGAKGVGPAADVYALGAILYECLTGRPPFRAATALETVMQVLRNEPVPPSRLTPGTPRDIETICLKCLQKDPARRYATAAALADDLERFGDGRSILARPTGPVEKVWKSARRRPAVAASIAAAAVALAAVVGVVSWKNAQLQTERDAARRAEADATEQRDAATVARAQAVNALADAEAERHKADARLELALEAIDRMMVRTAGEKWARNPALQAERRAVLEEAIALFRGFSGDAGNDARVRRRRALAEVRIATAYLALGEYPRAADALAAADAVQAALAAEFPADAGYANELALTALQTGHVRVITGKYDDALAAYERSAKLARGAVAGDPSREEYRLTLAESLTALGHYSSFRTPAAVLQYHAEVVALARELTGRPNPSYGARLFLAVGLLNLSGAEIARGRVPQGEELLAQSDRAFAALVGATAPTARWAEVFDLSRANLLIFRGGRVSRGDPAGGLKKIDDGLALVESLLVAQPRAFPVRLQKLNGLTARADVLGRLDRADDAKAAVRAVIDLSEAMAAEDPAVAWVRYRVVQQRSLDLVYRGQGGELADLESRAAGVLAMLPPRGPDPARNGAADTIRYNVACAYAQAARTAPAGDREKWAAGAVGLLRELARDGYFTPARVTHLDKDGDVDPLRDRDDYKAFRTGLPAPGKP